MTVRAAFALAVLLVTAFAPAPFPRTSRKNGDTEVSLRRLQGLWRVEGFGMSSSTGNHTKQNWHIKFIRIKNERWTFMNTATSENASYDLAIDGTRQPATLDFFSGPRTNGPSGVGIVRRDRDKVFIVYTFSRPEERAASFDARRIATGFSGWRRFVDAVVRGEQNACEIGELSCQHNGRFVQGSLRPSWSLWRRWPGVQTMTPEPPGRMVTTRSGLKYKDVKPGKGDAAKKGNKVTVHYTGWLSVGGKKGKEFDSSLNRNQPFSFDLGKGQVIKGWDEGVAGIKAGGKRTLIIPAALAYGKRGAGVQIPPDSDLIFEIEVVKIAP